MHAHIHTHTVKHKHIDRDIDEHGKSWEKRGNIERHTEYMIPVVETFSLFTRIHVNAAHFT